eukprot:TRINITY_DN880_c0_g2_i1.p3 TRINITY_DN880_c0_g2~~TRINITY_DN880_c0_g2_i1.p3  ORF type:complete len:126 (+),score=32.00 TRINITY_DN880_c0_g2_i1:99-476(+)
MGKTKVKTPKKVKGVSLKKSSTKLKQGRFVSKWIPKVPRPYHTIVFIINIFLPGFGTIIGALMDGCDLWNILFGILQLLTAILIIGWIWSIIWGFAMWKRQKGKYKYVPRVERPSERSPLTVNAR